MFDFGVVRGVDGVCRYGLVWSPLKAGHILGASEDMTICQWYVFGAILVFRGCSCVFAGISTRTPRRKQPSSRPQCSAGIHRSLEYVVQFAVA